MLVLVLSLGITAAAIVASFAPWVVYTISISGDSGTVKVNLWGFDDGSQTNTWGDLLNTAGYQFCPNKQESEQPDSSSLLQRIRGAEAAIILAAIFGAVASIMSILAICTSSSWPRKMVPVLAFCATIGATATLGLFLSVYYACGKSYCSALGEYASNPPPGVSTEFKCGVHYGLGLAIVAIVLDLIAAIVSCCCLRGSPNGSSAYPAPMPQHAQYTQYA